MSFQEVLLFLQFSNSIPQCASSLYINEARYNSLFNNVIKRFLSRLCGGIRIINITIITRFFLNFLRAIMAPPLIKLDAITYAFEKKNIIKNKLSFIKSYFKAQWLWRNIRF